MKADEFNFLFSQLDFVFKIVHEIIRPFHERLHVHNNT